MIPFYRRRSIVIWLIPFLICSFIPLNASDFDYYIYPQNIPLAAYHSLGFNNLESSPVALLPMGNPAAVSDYSQISAGGVFEYGKVKRFSSFFQLKTLNPWIPSSAAIVIPTGYFNLAIGFQKRYSGLIDLGKVFISTIEDPGGGELVESWFESQIYSEIVAIGHKFPLEILPKSSLSVGVQFSYNHFREKRLIGNLENRLQGGAVSGRSGLVFQVHERVKLGLLYINALKIQADFKSTGIDSIFTNPVPEKIVYDVNLPSVMAIGLWSQPCEKCEIASTVAKIFWNDSNREMKDQLEFSQSIIYYPGDLLGLSIGLYSTDLRYVYDYIGFNYQALFFGLGVKLRWEQFQIVWNFFDSSDFSDDARQQRILRLEVNWSNGKIES